MVYDFAGILVLGFIIGLTGALAPGPTLVATINSSLKKGWKAGPLVTLGHALTEVLMVVLVLTGLSMFITGYSFMIVIIGGAALVIFGILTLLESRHASVDITGETGKSDNPVLAGIVTSISNPYFWIWWFTVGSAILISALEGGWLLVIAFVVGHWFADLGWLTLVSLGIHRGRFFLSGRGYRYLLAVCGIFLIGFGVWFLISGVLIRLFLGVDV